MRLLDRLGLGRSRSLPSIGSAPPPAPRPPPSVGVPQAAPTAVTAATVAPAQGLVPFRPNAPKLGSGRHMTLAELSGRGLVSRDVLQNAQRAINAVGFPYDQPHPWAENFERLEQVLRLGNDDVDTARLADFIFEHLGRRVADGYLLDASAGVGAIAMELLGRRRFGYGFLEANEPDEIFTKNIALRFPGMQVTTDHWQTMIGGFSNLATLFSLNKQLGQLAQIDWSPSLRRFHELLEPNGLFMFNLPNPAALTLDFEGNLFTHPDLAVERVVVSDPELVVMKLELKPKALAPDRFEVGENRPKRLSARERDPEPAFVCLSRVSPNFVIPRLREAGFATLERFDGKELNRVTLNAPAGPDVDRITFACRKHG